MTKKQRSKRKCIGKNAGGITLIALVITIVVLIILASVGIFLSIGNNGILSKAQQAKNETTKQTATEKMNLKITNMQIEKYAKEQRMPTLQEFADGLCEDNEIQYVELQSKKVGSLSKIDVGDASSVFTKLKEYPYEFEINSSLQLASIDGVKVATNDTVTISKEDYENLLRYPDYTNQLAEITTVGGTWTATENCLMLAVIRMNTTAGNTPNILVDGVAVLSYNNYSGTSGSTTIPLYIKKGQTVSTRSDDIRGVTYTVRFYGLN